MKRKMLDIDNLVHRYETGESEKALAKFFDIARAGIRWRLLERGIQPRNRSAAMFVRMSRTPVEERARLTKAAHDAVRGTRHTFEHRCKIAVTREKRNVGGSRIERQCLSMLEEKGFTCVPQKAIGPYNVDIAITEPPIAVDIFGGGWHRSGRHAKRFRKRTDYILNQGWSPVVIWVIRNYPLESGAIKYIVSLAKLIRGGEPVRRQEHMIRGDGNFRAAGENKFNNWARKPCPNPRDNATGRYTSRAGQ